LVFKDQRLRRGVVGTPLIEKNKKVMEENYIYILAILIPVCYVLAFYITTK